MRTVTHTIYEIQFQMDLHMEGKTLKCLQDSTG